MYFSPKKFMYVCFLALPFLQVACLSNADRNNPLDPKSNNFDNTDVLAGRTLTFYSPFSPLAGVEVRLEPGPFVAVSNAQGQFQLESVTPGTYMLTVTKPGFATVLDTVVVNLQNNPDLEYHLDGLPQINTFTIRSARINRWFPSTDLFLLDVEAGIDDPDGLNDIAQVELSIPAVGFKDTLEASQVAGIYRGTILEDKIPGKNLQDLLGKEIFINVSDQPNYQTQSMPRLISRIFDLTPITDSPIGFTTVNTPTPTFTWKPVNLDIQFTYTVDVFSQNFGRVLPVFSESKIDQANTSFTAIQPMSPGSYFWTISIVDEFGNRAQSKEASFFIN